jgi:hypothetical protein
VPSRICPDGKTVAGPVCLRDPSGTCGWRVTDCPPAPTSCDWSQCPKPAPGAPNYTCPDGKTIAGPACVPVNGACGWTFVACPPPAAGGCACPSGQVCVQQIGGPAVADPPPPPACETPDADCLATIDAVDPSCACLAASDGRCKSAGAARTCTCDNGIR